MAEKRVGLGKRRNAKLKTCCTMNSPSQFCVYFILFCECNICHCLGAWQKLICCSLLTANHNWEWYEDGIRENLTWQTLLPFTYFLFSSSSHFTAVPFYCLFFNIHPFYEHHVLCFSREAENERKRIIKKLFCEQYTILLAVEMLLLSLLKHIYTFIEWDASI